MGAAGHQARAPDAPDLGAEEAVRQDGEGRGVPGGAELVHRRRGGRLAQEAPPGQLAVDVLGGLLAGGHEGHVLPHDVGDRPDEQRVVGAAEDEGVDAGLAHGHEVLLGGGHDLGAGGHAPLGELDEAGAGHGQELDARHGPERVGVGARVDGPLGGDQPDPPVVGDAGGGPGGGVDDLDDGHPLALRVAAAGVVQDGGGGGVARDDEHLDPGVDELVHDAQGEPAHLLDGAGPVGAVGGVADVEDLLAGELVEDRPRHRQAADAGVEHPDGRVIHVVETRRGPDRAAARGAVIPATR